MAKTSTSFGQRREFSANMPAVNSGANIPTIQFSQGNARSLQQFSRALFGLSSQFEDQLDETAEAEAQKEGAVAGLAGNTEEQSYETIRGRAYNRAMLETFVTSLDTKAMLGIAERQQQYYNDPVALEKSLDGFLGGISAEVEKVAPGAGASFVGRQTARAIPAVEAARDERVRQTRDEAAANITLYEDALMNDVSRNAAGMFSPNPKVSAAASGAVAQSVGEYLRLYDAVDPATGRPSFTAAEKAAAEVHVRRRVSKEAYRSWFMAQEDKLEAYMALADDDTTFKINMPGQTKAKVVYANQGKTRNLPVNKKIIQGLEIAGGATGSGIEVHISSGGQVTAEEARRGLGRRTGATNHDHGNAADVVLSVNGKQVTPQEAPQLYQKFLENAAAAGFTGLGHYDWGVHVDYQGERAWGPDTTRRTLDPQYAAAIDRGRARARNGGLQLDPGNVIDVTLKSVLGEAEFNSFSAELRQQMAFENQIVEQREKKMRARIEAEQDLNNTQYLTQILAPSAIDPRTGEAYGDTTVESILTAEARNELAPSQAQALIRAITVDKPERSDPALYKQLQLAMWSNEDIQADILANVHRLSQGDADKLLIKNRELNGEGGAIFSKEEDYYNKELRRLLGADNMFSSMDDWQQTRTFEALDEYRERIKSRTQTGEALPDIVRDISRRALVDAQTEKGRDMDSLISPRFAVPVRGDEVRVKAGGKEQGISVSGRRWFDIAASKKALREALAAGRITEEAADAQSTLLKQWEGAQMDYLRDQVKILETEK